MIVLNLGVFVLCFVGFFFAGYIAGRRNKSK